ncbi:MAG: hypothetical protein HOK89_08780 [Rhodospirillaceae bacterium]|jgi:hypothetical protein|nr:hypothetical protein [Rhodospirillaceae bacterium]
MRMSVLMMKINTLIILLLSLYQAHHIHADEIEVFEEVEIYGIYEAYDCTIEKTYITGSGRSTDIRGGKLRITITNEDVEINSVLGNVDSGSLTLLVKSEQEIIARSDSMMFIYGVNSHKFSFDTGNGQSKFRGGVGHVGKQIRIEGTCIDS